MSLTKEQTKHFITRLAVIASKKKQAVYVPKEPKEVTQARKLIREWDDSWYKQSVAKRQVIEEEQTRILDMLYFGEQSELVAALAAFEKDF